MMKPPLQELDYAPEQLSRLSEHPLTFKDRHAVLKRSQYRSALDLHAQNNLRKLKMEETASMQEYLRRHNHTDLKTFSESQIQPLSTITSQIALQSSPDIANYKKVGTLS